MKTILFLIAMTLVGGHMFAQNNNPGIQATFQLIDENGEPVRDKNIEVRVTFATMDNNGNKVDVYVEEFLSRTTQNGFFKREIGAKYGDLPKVLFGKYADVNFADTNLCIRVDYRLPQVWPMDWVIGEGSKLGAVPLAAQVIKNLDADDDPQNEIQKISKEGDEILLSKGGGNIVLQDDDPTNELQILDFDEGTGTLLLEGGNSVDLSGLKQFSDNGNILRTDKTIQAGQFITENGQTDIQEGKISLRYANGFDGIEMGIDDVFCAPFISFIDCKGNSLGSFRMGPQGFKFYPE